VIDRHALNQYSAINLMGDLISC